MNILPNFNFTKENIKEHLFVESKTDSLINYESVLLINPITQLSFPEFDHIFFERMSATLRHILYQYEKGWIQSERQILYTSNECLTTVQFVHRGDRIQLNVFQRSSNVNNLKEDVQFLNYFLEKYFENQLHELNIFVSMPHEFLDKKTKVD